jgi:hypothetical protein
MIFRCDNKEKQFVKYFLLLLFFVLPLINFAQFINCKVQDAETKQPLYYATVYYGKQPAITFSDSTGNFFVRSEILKEKDSIKIEFIGYKTLFISIKEITENKTFYLQKSSNNLKEVVVKNCNEYEEKEIDADAKPKLGDHYSISPGGRIIFIGLYTSKEKISGYITALKFHVNSFPLLHENFDVKLRIRWYKWDDIHQMPSSELTDTNIIIQAYKRGWNKINIPDRVIPFEEIGVVIGVEFLYPTVMEKEFFQLKSSDERNKWMNRNTLSIGRVICNNSNETFCKMGANPISSQNLFMQNKNLKIALDFTIKTCKN